eukprot:12760415-Alexandrium_andersonii.AAC.1
MEVTLHSLFAWGHPDPPVAQLRPLQPLLGLGFAPTAHMHDVPEELALGVDTNHLAMDLLVTQALALWVDLQSTVLPGWTRWLVFKSTSSEW